MNESEEGIEKKCFGVGTKILCLQARNGRMDWMDRWIAQSSGREAPAVNLFRGCVVCVSERWRELQCGNSAATTPSQRPEWGLLD